ncbi:MAG: response regulator [Ectothiorhodospiraceae bacterium]|nr:response regulator [Ectothiorhodospiraceae bacterium]
MEILLIDDSLGDIRLIQEGLREAKIPHNISACMDGVAALAFLRKETGYDNAPRPDLILLDLNMPRMGGNECLQAIKQDATLASIPVVVLSTSQADHDIQESYLHRANCYITKPMNYEKFMEVVKSIGDFWLKASKQPQS